MRSRRVNDLNRVMNRVKVADNGCWEWTGPPRRDGYAELDVNCVRWLLHRYVYTQLKGPIPEGLVIDHLCRNRKCCNPEHLEAVPQRVNVIRGNLALAAKIKAAKRTHCPQGHPYDEENTYKDAYGRHCRICGREANRKDYYRKKALTNGCTVLTKIVVGN